MNRAEGSLKYATVVDSTRKAYCRAVLRFRAWAARRNRRAHSPEQLDVLLEEYFDDWFYSGGGVAGARNVYYGSCFLHPELAGSLPRSARALKRYGEAAAVSIVASACVRACSLHRSTYLQQHVAAGSRA
jgi:hypothetical protein